MGIYEKLLTILKKQPELITENGELKKWLAINKIQNYDAALIQCLLEDKEVKDMFFVQTGKALVLKQSLLIRFLEQKNYLQNSFTSYKNKVGLTANKQYLSQFNEVVLAWPFKDCILEGGQSREEQKKQEIFFNEVLAADEITQLFEPKVFTSAVKTNAKGNTRLTQFNRNKEGIITDNLIIKGNNLLALSSLQPVFGGRVNLIYIDPPYNTGSDSFQYNDSFKQSTWLTFMKNRIEAAKKLLAPGGVFLVQCSFHQFAWLKVLMHEIFEKHLCDLHIQVRHPERVLTGDKEYNDVIEYILVYTNDRNKKMPYREEVKTTEEYTYKIHLRKPGTTSLLFDNRLVEVYLPHEYEIERVPPSADGLKKISIRGSIREKNSSGRFFVKHLENLQGYPPQTLFKVPEMGDDTLGHRFFYSAPAGKKNGGYYQGMPQSSGVTRKQYSNFYNFEKEYNNVSAQGGVVFRNGKKPEELLHFLIELFTTQGDLVLDYHLGSGTTAAVCHKTNRRYIGLEQMQEQIDLSLTRLRNVIHGDKTGVSSLEEVNWKGGGEFVYMELKKYNQFFAEKILAASNFTDLLDIQEDMKTKSFLHFYINIQKQEANKEEFATLPLEAQKSILMNWLDKNQLYVNLSSLQDQDFSCTDEEKVITKDFYKIKE